MLVRVLHHVQNRRIVVPREVAAFPLGALGVRERAGCAHDGLLRNHHQPTSIRTPVLAWAWAVLLRNSV